jgi:hypothetical protein
MKTSKANSRNKEVVSIPASATKLYRQAARHLALKFQRPPSTKTLILLALRRQGVSAILEDFYGWNELAKKYRPLTPVQLRQRVLQSRRVE